MTVRPVWCCLRAEDDWYESLGVGMSEFSRRRRSRAKVILFAYAAYCSIFGLYGRPGKVGRRLGLPSCVGVWSNGHIICVRDILVSHFAPDKEDKKAGWDEGWSENCDVNTLTLSGQIFR